MRRNMRVALLGLGTVLMVTIVWAARAAPIVPVQDKVADEILSLAGMHRVQLHMLDLPPSLTRAGLEADQVRELCMDQFARGALEVEDDPSLPRLDIWFKDVDDDDHPDMRSVITVISVYQPVDVPRLDRRMVLPTACFVGGTMTSERNLVQALMRDLSRRCANLARAIEQASIAN